MLAKPKGYTVKIEELLKIRCSENCISLPARNTSETLYPDFFGPERLAVYVPLFPVKSTASGENGGWPPFTSFVAEKSRFKLKTQPSTWSFI